jgi:molybdenum cofactor sulfurtransferase
MAMIRPRVDRDRRVLTAQVGQDEIVVPLDEEIPRADTVQDKVCGQQVEPQIYKDKQVQRVLSQWLGIPCTLARQPLASRHTKLGGGDRTPLLLSNESPFLLINKDSVDCVSEWLKDPELGGSGDLPRQSAAVFRANFVISSSGGNNSPFIEDNARSFSIGPHRFISLGPCRRCLMVCVDQCTGEVRKETYLALAKHRRNARGRIEFGQHLMWRQDDDCEREARVAPGMAVTLHVA